MARVAGHLFLKVNGVQRKVIGNFTYNLGRSRKQMLVGHDGPHGYSEMPQVAYIEGEIRDESDLSVVELREITDATITLELANGKTILLRDAHEASEGSVGTEAANVQVRFEGVEAEEV